MDKLILAGNNTLADLTLGANLQLVATSAAGTTLLRDVNGDETFSFTLTAGQAVKVQSSVFASISSLNPGNLQSTNLLVIDSQINAFNLAPYQNTGASGVVSGVHCVSTFDAAYTLHPGNCN